MKKRRIRTRKKLNILISIFAVILIFLTSCIIIKLTNKKDASISADEYIEQLFTKQDINIQEVAERNSWGKNIIGSITDEEIPIPIGYEYKKGDLNTGVIIRESSTGAELLWIPYKENVKNNVNEYYKNIQVNDISLEDMESIEKYGGFYVYLNMNNEKEDLKSISKEQYKNYAEQLSSIGENVNTHILSKKEIGQINNYLKNNNIDLGKSTIGVQAVVIDLFSKIKASELKLDIGDPSNKYNVGSSVAQNIEITKTSNIKLANTENNTTNNNYENYVYWYETSSKQYGGSSDNKVKIPIPSGFNYRETEEGTIIIQDIGNKNLIYIWVPLNYNELGQVKNNLWNNIYKKYKNDQGQTFSENTELYKIISSSIDDDTTLFNKSIEKYNGFYMSQAELSKDKNNEYLNISRGMGNYSVTETIEGGDYLRGYTYNEIQNIAKDLNKNTSVTSHLTYGIEYDATLLWIAQTNQDYKKNGLDIYSLLCSNSTSIGKYSNSKLGANAGAEEVKSFNNIWGLGGNLSEVTQEKYNDKYILRGGSYNDTGDNSPIASRKATTILNKQDVGFRTCLYINTDAILANQTQETKEETIDNIVFEKMNNAVSRWTNDWDGVKIYSKPDENSEVIETLPFASRVVVYSKAKEKAREDLWWAKVKIDGTGEDVYINAMQLANSIEISDADFIIGKAINRLCKQDEKLYKNPSKDAEYIKTELNEVTVCGKSIDWQWSLVEKDGQNYFMEEENLNGSTEEEIDGVIFEMYNTPKKAYAHNWYGLLVCDKMIGENDYVLVERTISYANEVIVIGKAKEKVSEDLWWAKVLLPDNTEGFVNANFLKDENSLTYIKDNSGNNEAFLKSEEVVRYFEKNLTVYNKPDYSNEDILEEYSDRGSIIVIGKSINCIWAMVEIEGKTGYVYANQLVQYQVENSSLVYLSEINKKDSNEVEIKTYIENMGEKINREIREIKVKNLSTNKINLVDVSRLKYDKQKNLHYCEYKLEDDGWYEISFIDDKGKIEIQKVYNSNKEDIINIYTNQEKIFIETDGKNIETLKINNKNAVFKKSESGKFYYEYDKSLKGKSILVEIIDKNGKRFKKYIHI